MELERLRFMTKVNQNSGRKIRDLSECWFWKGTRDKRDGYCRNQTDWAKENSVIYAHQSAYKLFKDETYKPSRDNPCSHLCEAPDDYLSRICCNPDHLVVKSLAENIGDRDANRGAYQAIKTGGLKSNFAIFTKEQLDNIKQLRQEGMFYKDIAKRFDCNRRTIERICLEKTYKHD